MGGLCGGGAAFGLFWRGFTFGRGFAYRRHGADLCGEGALGRAGADDRFCVCIWVDIAEMPVLRRDDHLYRHVGADGGGGDGELAAPSVSGQRTGDSERAFAGAENLDVDRRGGMHGCILLHIAALGTANLAVSTISVTTSFLAAYLTACRSPYYALAYAGNDIVLWIAAARTQPDCIPMIACFAAFLANDIYGFYAWQRMKRRQRGV